MIAHMKDFEKKLDAINLSKKQVAKAAGMQRGTFMNKLIKPECNFTLGEADYLAELTQMTNKEFLWIFFGILLSFNESSNY
jgi:hypothetical protein